METEYSFLFCLLSSPLLLVFVVDQWCGKKFMGRRFSLFWTVFYGAAEASSPFFLKPYRCLAIHKFQYKCGEFLSFFYSLVEPHLTLDLCNRQRDWDRKDRHYAAILLLLFVGGHQLISFSLTLHLPFHPYTNHSINDGWITLLSFFY